MSDSLPANDVFPLQVRRFNSFIMSMLVVLRTGKKAPRIFIFCFPFSFLNIFSWASVHLQPVISADLTYKLQL